jgi:hypothetical protein
MGRLPRSVFLLGLRALALALLVACVAHDTPPTEPRAASAQAPSRALPWGTSARWERDTYTHGQHLCFEVRGERFQLSVWPEGLRNPALVRGRYEVAPARGTDASVSVLTLHVERITQLRRQRLNDLVGHALRGGQHGPAGGHGGGHPAPASLPGPHLWRDAVRHHT